ncbi:hypothetical protein [Aeromonas caviae]|uniref:hypothetical protein n=1 Tax=Aeromonas caviae TaxID=648 RepID=UPI0013A58B22|nr:hypothetical protein [Aeromonas caviae]
MSGGNGLHARHQYQGGGMKDDKDGTQLCGQWHRVCELAALPEQAGRSAWLEGRGAAPGAWATPTLGADRRWGVWGGGRAW